MKCHLVCNVISRNLERNQIRDLNYYKTQNNMLSNCPIRDSVAVDLRLTHILETIIQHQQMILGGQCTPSPELPAVANDSPLPAELLMSVTNHQPVPISRKCRNSMQTAKFRGSAQNSACRGKLWSLLILHTGFSICIEFHYATCCDRCVSEIPTSTSRERR